MNQPSNDDDKVWVGYHVVCLMDILGQQEKLQKWPQLPEGDEPPEEFIKALKETSGTIRSYRDLFVSFFNQYKSVSDEFLTRPLSDKGREMYVRITGPSVKWQQFSDTTIFYAPVVNSYGDFSLEAVRRIILASASMTICGLAAGAPIRGAITVGLGMEIESGFYGPALAEAHYMESKVARHPRIVVSNAAMKLATAKKGFSNEPAVEVIFSAYAKSQDTLVCTDSDGVGIVDFMGKGVKNILPEDDEFAQVVRDAADFVESEITRFKRDGDEKLATRYSALLEYVQSRLPIWTDAS